MNLILRFGSEGGLLTSIEEEKHSAIGFLADPAKPGSLLHFHRDSFYVIK